MGCTRDVRHPPGCPMGKSIFSSVSQQSSFPGQGRRNLPFPEPRTRSSDSGRTTRHPRMHTRRSALEGEAPQLTQPRSWYAKQVPLADGTGGKPAGTSRSWPLHRRPLGSQNCSLGQRLCRGKTQETAFKQLTFQKRQGREKKSCPVLGEVKHRSRLRFCRFPLRDGSVGFSSSCRDSL